MQIGASAPLDGCGFTVFGADVTLTGNTVPSFVSDNVIRGELACSGNDPAPIVSGGRIRGGATGQCATASAAGASIASSSPAGRTADVARKITERRGAGESAASAAGRAPIGG